MNRFELFKLKRAGLTNLNINHILAYQEKIGKSLSLRDMAVVSKCKHPVLFMENYKRLDLKQVKADFQRFPSISLLDKDYPDSLRQTYNPPVLLFYQGDLALLSKPKLAVVGARKCSQTGIDSVKKIISELNNRFVIVSGLARGIDTAAHFSILRNGGATIAVIGTGLDVYYPKENHKLQEFIGKNHLLLSEYGPGEKPLTYHFPERNRIISGISEGVLVVEAKLRSGSLITCERALEEGREVFAVPGNILDGFSTGCHHLIQEGAKCVISGLDIVSEFSF